MNMKPGDVVHVWSADAKTERGTATIESMTDTEITFDGVLPGGTRKGDLLQLDEDYRRMMDSLGKNCQPITASMPKDFFGELKWSATHE
jgi:hypothetical protein